VLPGRRRRAGVPPLVDPRLTRIADFGAG